jgi:hypothetical protein
MKILREEITMKSRMSKVTRRRKLRENTKKSTPTLTTSIMKTPKEIL